MEGYRSVKELNRDELDELKQAYLCEKNPSPSYGELAESTNIPDEEIFDHYDNVGFSPEDFFCSSRGKED